jgi:hypothetical protein
MQMNKDTDFDWKVGHLYRKLSWIQNRLPSMSLSSSDIDAHAVLRLYMSRLCHLNEPGDTRDEPNQRISYRKVEACVGKWPDAVQQRNESPCFGIFQRFRA